MVFPFSLELTGKTLYFIYDAESGSLHNVDSAAFLVAKKRYSQLDEGEETPYKAVSSDDVDEINAELDELEQKGLLNTPQKKYEIPFTGEIKALCLHICHDCNLRCSYCFAKDGTYNTPRDYMSFEVGKNALDMLFERSGKRKNLEVDFFGGEPLLNFEVVKQLVQYGNDLAKKYGKNISFTMTTNCVGLDEKKRVYLNETMDNVVLSIDGRDFVHDALRVMPGGHGSHAIALKNALAFRAIRGDKRYYVRGTFTHNNLDFATDVLYLNDAGFDQISVEPVVLDASNPLALTEKDLPKILEEYGKLADEYVKRRKGDKWFNFFHFMIDLEHGPCVLKRLRGCSAGCEYLAVSPVGDIYPCHQFVGDSRYYIGNVLTGEFNADIQRAFAENTVYQKENCSNCIAKYYCSGGCAANSLHFAGAINKNHHMSCEMMKRRFLLSLAIYYVEKACN